MDDECGFIIGGPNCCPFSSCLQGPSNTEQNIIIDAVVNFGWLRIMSHTGFYYVAIIVGFLFVCMVASVLRMTTKFECASCNGALKH